MSWRTLLVAAIALAGGCDRKSSASSEGMPAASDWSAPAPMASGVEGQGDQGADPHAGMDMDGMGGGDPHAGMDMGDMGGGDPHAGMDLDGDPRMAAIQPPDPDRPIDESRFLAGTISASPALAAKVKAGQILFLSAKPVNPVTGEVIGGPLAAERIDISAMPVSFKLTERNAMSAGTQLQGDVLIHARIDGDGDAISKEAGDIVGEIRAKVPAGELALVLDTELR